MHITQCTSLTSSDRWTHTVLRCASHLYFMCYRGVVDTDMMLGNVNGFLHRKGLLDDYDIISPCCNVNYLGFKSFGPFMLYRNVPRITELFRQMESLYDSLSNQTVMMIDEWGGFAPDGGLHGPYYDRSMTKLILDKKDALHIRVVGEFVSIDAGAPQGTYCTSVWAVSVVPWDQEDGQSLGGSERPIQAQADGVLPLPIRERCHGSKSSRNVARRDGSAARGASD
jgi:hypothetical protein